MKMRLYLTALIAAACGFVSGCRNQPWHLELVGEISSDAIPEGLQEEFHKMPMAAAISGDRFTQISAKFLIVNAGSTEDVKTGGKAFILSYGSKIDTIRSTPSLWIRQGEPNSKKWYLYHYPVAFYSKMAKDVPFELHAGDAD